MRNLKLALFFLAVLIPILILGFQGPNTSESLENLQGDRIGSAEDKVESKPINKQVIVQAPENKIQQLKKKTEKHREKKVIVIDPGHQRYADFRLEKSGPKSDKWMPKMPASTYGVKTGQAEHQLTLDVANYLKKDLEKRGYKVKLTRQKNVIAKSVKERAAFAKNNKADLYIQLHADGLTNAQASGMYVITPAKANPYTTAIYKDSQKLGQSIIQHAKKQKIAVYKKGQVKSADLTALNWSKMPTVLVELGYLNNAKDDLRLSEKTYQQKLAKTIAAGIEIYYQP